MGPAPVSPSRAELIFRATLLLKRKDAEIEHEIKSNEIEGEWNYNRKKKEKE